jgi:hypothetical protein
MIWAPDSPLPALAKLQTEYGDGVTMLREVGDDR